MIRLFLSLSLLFLWGLPVYAEPTIVVLGDSLTSGYGLPKKDAFPAQLERNLKKWFEGVQVINMGLSGDTTSGGVHRAQSIPELKPDAVIIELGGNDLLRRLPPEAIQENLSKMVSYLKANGVTKIMLAGIHAPSSQEPEYAAKFNRVFPLVAREHQLLLYPHFLNGVAGNPEYNLPDGVHPNPKGIAVIVQGITPYVYKLLKN